MKLNFLKNFKKEKSLSLKSLKSPLFSIDFFWFVCLGSISLLLFIMAAIGCKFFHYQYFEDYKNITTFESTDLINVERLKSTIKKRNDFVNKEVSLPLDPSL